MKMLFAAAGMAAALSLSACNIGGGIPGEQLPLADWIKDALQTGCSFVPTIDFVADLVEQFGVTIPFDNARDVITEICDRVTQAGTATMEGSPGAPEPTINGIVIRGQFMAPAGPPPG